MKKLYQTLLIAMTLVSVVLLIFSCQKKERSDYNLSDSEPVPNAIVQELKAWQAATTSSHQTNSLATLSTTGNTTVKKALQPQWDGIKYQTLNSGERVIVVPAPGFTLGNKAYQFSRYFVYKENNGQVTSGNIVEFVFKTDSSTTADNALSKFQETKIAGYNGAVITYDVNYNYKNSKFFKNGNQVSTRSYIGKKLKVNINSTNQTQTKRIASTRVLDDEDFCTQYYLYTYYYDPYGYLYDETIAYLFTMCGAEGGNPEPPGGGSDNGAPPPPPPPGQDPCGQKNTVGTRSANATINAQDNTILTNTLANGVEYGADQKLTTWPGYTYINTPVTTQGASGLWTPGFTWNTVDGYTLGWSHGHPQGTAPSPNDAFHLLDPLTNTQLTSAGADAVQFYKDNAYTTTKTATGTYIITVKDWSELQTMHDLYFSTPQQQADFNSNYQTCGLEYYSQHPNTNNGEAGAYAILQTLPYHVNLYYAPTGSTTFVPQYVTHSSNIDSVVSLPCQ